MLKLPNVTLCAVTSIEIGKTIRALKKSMKGVEYAKVILLTHEKVSLEEMGIQVIQIKKLGYEDYSRFMLYELKDYIDTDFVLLIQYDGYVLRPNKWNNEFLDYDYIGAPWRKGVNFKKDGTNIRVGNGGFSLRSKRLLNILTDLNLPFTDNGTGFSHEDGVLCVYYREILEEHGIKYAPVETASRFSRERWCLDSKIFTFGFHNNRRNLATFILKKLRKLFKKNSVTP